MLPPLISRCTAYDEDNFAEITNFSIFIGAIPPILNITLGEE